MVREEGRECGVSFTRKVELGVIRVAVEINIEFAKDIATRKKVDDKEKGPEQSSREFMM